MKKLMTVLTVCALALSGCVTSGTTTTSSTSSDATSLLSNVVSGLSSSASSTAATTTNTLTNVLSSLLGSTTTLSANSLVGTWNYTGSACVLKSDNALAQLGGTLATSQVESKLDTYLAKVGIKAGSCTFTFGSDNTCTCKFGSRTLTGTYTLDTTNKKVTILFQQVWQATAYVTFSGSQLELVFNADKVLSLATKVSALSSANSTIATISSLLSNYKGMMVGMKMTK